MTEIDKTRNDAQDQLKISLEILTTYDDSINVRRNMAALLIEECLHNKSSPDKLYQTLIAYQEEDFGELNEAVAPYDDGRIDDNLPLPPLQDNQSTDDRKLIRSTVTKAADLFGLLLTLRQESTQNLQLAKAIMDAGPVLQHLIIPYSNSVPGCRTAAPTRK